MKRTIRLLALTAVAAATLSMAAAAGAQEADVILIDPPVPVDAPVADGEVRLGEGIRVERTHPTPPTASEPTPEPADAPADAADAADAAMQSPVQPGSSGAEATDGVEVSVPHPPAAPILDPNPPAVHAPPATSSSPVVIGPAKAGRTREVALDSAPLVSHRSAPWRGLPLVIVLVVGASAIATTEVVRRRSMRLARV